MFSSWFSWNVYCVGLLLLFPISLSNFPNFCCLAKFLVCFLLGFLEIMWDYYFYYYYYSLFLCLTFLICVAWQNSWSVFFLVFLKLGLLLFLLSISLSNISSLCCLAKLLVWFFLGFLELCYMGLSILLLFPISLPNTCFAPFFPGRHVEQGADKKSDRARWFQMLWWRLLGFLESLTILVWRGGSTRENFCQPANAG